MERPDFVPFFREIIDHQDCSSLDAVLYGYIYWLTCLKGEKCFASNETLAALAKTTPTSIRNSLTTLERAGFIERVYENGNPRLGRLEIIPLVRFGKVAPTGARGSTHRLQGVAPTGAYKESIEREHINADSFESGFPEVKESSDDGELKAPKTPRDPFLLKAAKVWHKKCKDEFGREPSGGLTKAMKVLSDARKKLTDDQIKEKMMDWFKGSDLQEYEAMQITRCFSAFQIDKYLSEL